MKIDVKNTMRSIRNVSVAVVGEVEDESEMRKLKEENDHMDAKTRFFYCKVRR
jgi:hypothetical protein